MYTIGINLQNVGPIVNMNKYSNNQSICLDCHWVYCGSGSGMHNIATVGRGRGDTQLTRVVLSLSMLPLKHLYPVDIYYLLSSVNKPGGTGFS